MGNGQTVLQFGAALVNAVTPKSFFFFFFLGVSLVDTGLIQILAFL